MLNVRDGAREVVFMIAYEAQPISDDDKVTVIITRAYSNLLRGGC